MHSRDGEGNKILSKVFRRRAPQDALLSGAVPVHACESADTGSASGQLLASGFSGLIFNLSLVTHSTNISVLASFQSLEVQW